MTAISPMYVKTQHRSGNPGNTVLTTSHNVPRLMLSHIRRATGRGRSTFDGEPAFVLPRRGFAADSAS